MAFSIYKVYCVLASAYNLKKMGIYFLNKLNLPCLQKSKETNHNLYKFTNNPDRDARGTGTSIFENTDCNKNKCRTIINSNGARYRRNVSVARRGGRPRH